MPRPYKFRGGKQNGKSEPQHEFTFRSRFPKTSARPLLTSKRETTPEYMGASEENGYQPKKFMDVEVMTDSDEAEMDVSSADEGDLEPPRKKQATESGPAAAPAAPKWSNPDPYTVLPPPDESQAKKRDVVKMIRKARIQQQTAESKPEENNAVVSNEDFISFGSEGLGLGSPPPEDAPRGPRALRDQDGDPALGNRKRTHDDEITGPSSLPKKPSKPEKFSSDGSPLLRWRSLPGQNPTPWLDSTMSMNVHPGSKLHCEILDFYDWVKPKAFENVIRNDLVSRLQSLFEKRHFGSQVHAFGSFASGLYLPVADMDLVLLSRNFVRQGKKTLCQRPREIFSFARFLKDADVAAPGSIETIAHARVPIIKFVDRLTGLRVDLSFDNTSGIAANTTFQVWKTQFPAMPVIVSIVKQFLLLRGLNEVPSGGLGGFSIICLVTSLLQHLPNSGSSPNLASLLMDFFDLYGNKFDIPTVGIQFDPPGYFDKRLFGVYHANQAKRLSIIDPNKADNDISGGTKEIALIFRCFADAYRTLKDCLVSAAYDSKGSLDSFLGTIIGGNYESYDFQREHLLDLFDNDPRFASYHPPPPPPPESPPPELPSAPLPPAPKPQASKKSKAKSKNTADSEADDTKLTKKAQAAFDRANRLRTLRPDLEVPKFVSVESGIKIGGYSSLSEYDRDLNQREKALLSVAAPT